MPSKEETLAHYQQVMAAEKAYFESNETRFNEAADLFATPSQDRFRGLMRAAQKNPTSYTSEPRPSHWLINLAFREMSREPENSQRGHEIAEVSASLLYPMGNITATSAGIPGTLTDVDHETCDRAEVFFTNAVEQVVRRTNQDQPRLSVYHTKEKEPLALRKTFDASTALLLRDITVNGGFVPAGTIVGVGNIKRTGQTIQASRIMQSYEVIPPFTISPIRLSPWAYADALDRSLFGIGKEGTQPIIYDPGRARRVAHYELANFVEASELIMKACVEEPVLLRN